MTNYSNVIPPFNLDVEKSVIGAMLISQLAIIEAIEIVNKDSFYDLKNSIIFQGIVSCFNKNIIADIITIPNEIKTIDKNEIVTIDYLMDLSVLMPTAANVKNHCHILQEYYIKRIVLRNAIQTIKEIQVNKIDALDILEKQQNQYENVVNKITYQISTPTTQSELLLNGYKKATSGLIKTYDTGLNIVDRNIKFIKPGKSIIIAARTSIGKTALALSLQRNLAKQGAKTGYLTCEMTAYELLLRHTAMELNINSELLDTGHKNYFAENKIIEFSGIVQDRNMYFEEFSELNEIGLKAKIRRMVKLFGVEIVFIDYLGQIEGSNKKAVREEQISTISKTIKSLVMELNITIFTLAQLNRETEKTKSRTPAIHQARGSGSIEQDADVMILIDRPEQNDIKFFEDGESTIGKARLIFGKNRGGKIGIMTVDFTKETTLFWDDSPNPFDTDNSFQDVPQHVHKNGVMKFENNYVDNDDEDPF